MTVKYNTLPDVIAFAEFAHRKQTDKAGLPYIEHPRRVMKSVQQQGALPFVQMAAILHDVIEDTPFTGQILREIGIPEATVVLVELLTRDTYPEEYYARIAKNRDALMVKLADIDDNLQSWRLSYLDERTQARLRAKYAKAKYELGVLTKIEFDLAVEAISGFKQQ